jgi:putative transcriptional regulator
MSAAIHRHPDAATLMSFAAGTLAEPLSAVVSAHAAMCRQCRRELADMELIGGVLMSAERTSDMLALARIPTRPADPPRAAAAATRAASPSDRLPAPIAAAYALSFDTIPWKRLGPGVHHHRLALSPGSEGDLRLLRIAPGTRMPEHGHSGAELTLVLDGAYADETGVYCRGDMQDVDAEIDHTPVSDRTTGCVCLIASEGPARFKSVIARIVQPFTGM